MTKSEFSFQKYGIPKKWSNDVSNYRHTDLRRIIKKRKMNKKLVF